MYLGVQFGGGVLEEFKALGHFAAHDLGTTVGGQSQDADLDLTHLLDDIGWRDALPGLIRIRGGGVFGEGGIIHIGRHGIPRCQRGFARGTYEQIQEALRAVDELPITRGVGIDVEFINDIYDSLTLGVEHFGRALYGVAGVQ